MKVNGQLLSCRTLSSFPVKYNANCRVATLNSMQTKGASLQQKRTTIIKILIKAKASKRMYLIHFTLLNEIEWHFQLLKVLSINTHNKHAWKQIVKYVRIYQAPTVLTKIKKAKRLVRDVNGDAVNNINNLRLNTVTKSFVIAITSININVLQKHNTKYKMVHLKLKAWFIRNSHLLCLNDSYAVISSC